MSVTARIALPEQASVAAGVGRWFLPLAASAAVVGALATVSPVYAVLFALTIGLVVLVMANVEALTVFLIVTMFLESLALGPGLRIGRLAGVLAVVVLLFWMLLHGAGGLRASPLLLLGAGYGLWMLVSGLWAGSGSYVLTYLTHWALSASYMLAFAVLVRSRRTVFLVFATLAVGALIVGLFSFIGYLSHGSQYLASGRGATGLQGDHNYFAVYQAIALPATLTLAALERRRALRALYTAAVVVIALSVVASLSRTGLFALVGVVLVTVLVPSRFFFRRSSQKLSYIGALIIAAAVVGLAGSSPFLTRVQSIWQSPGGIAGHAGSGRIDLWRAAWQGYTHHPVLGLGAGNFQAHSIELLQQTPGADTSAAYALKNFVVHNMYLETLTDLGPVGLAILLVLIVLTGAAFYRSFRRSRRNGDRTLELFSIALLVSLVAYCIGGFFLSIEFNKPLWILIGLALAFDVMSRSEGEEPVTSSGAPAFALAGGGGSGFVPPEPPRRTRKEETTPEDELGTLSSERARLDRLRTLLAVREARILERESLLARIPEAEALETKATEVAAAAAQLAEREASVRAELEQLDAARTELEQRESEADRRLAESTTAQSDLEQQLAALAAEWERIEAERTSVESRLQVRAAELEERDAAVARLEARRSELDRREADAAAQLARAAAVRAEIESKLEARTHDFEQREARLTAELERVSALRADLERQVASRSAQLDERVSDAALQLERAAAFRAELESRVEKRTVELDERESRVADELQRLAAQHAEVDAQAAQIAKEREQLDTLRVGVEERLDARTAELDAREASVAAAQTAFEQRLQAHTAEVERTGAARAELERRVQQRADELDEREQELERRFEQRAKDLDAREAAVAAELERVALRRTELEERLDSRAAELSSTADELATRSTDVERRERELEREKATLTDMLSKFERRAAELQELDRALEARAGELEDRNRALELQATHVRDRERALDVRAAELTRRGAEPVHVEPTVDPVAFLDELPPVERFVASPVPASPSAPALALAAPAGAPTLHTLEALVSADGASYPDRLDEWGYYLLYLRDFADVDGRLGEAFEQLVWEVFEPLLAR